MTIHVGIDFGTTNSALAVAEGNAPPRLIPLPGVGGSGAGETWRTVLFFEPHPVTGRPVATAGAPAIGRYLELEGDGRLVQSIKSHLASNLFTRTQINGRAFTLPALVGAFLRALREAAPMELGRRAVVGRPVRYWGAESEADDARAIERMREALALAGFDDVVFELEPIAAAGSYAARLPSDELVMVADLGGGTADFSLVRVGPDAPAGEVLGTGGIGVSGDAFDARVVDRVLAPALGKDSRYRDELGMEAPVPAWLYTRLRRWHHLSFLKEPKTLKLLERLRTGAIEPEKIERLVSVIDGDLGLPLHRAIEETKVALSKTEQAVLGFDRGGVRLHHAMSREAFEEWIDDDLRTIDGVVGELLVSAGVEAGEVDRVFATGGSSLVPAVRGMLARRFGEGKVIGGEELTSVAWGLAARARELFG